jgi:hypothetical protein
MDYWRILGNFIAAFGTAFIATNYYASPEAFNVSLLNGMIAGSVAALLEYKKLSELVRPKTVLML